MPSFYQGDLFRSLNADRGVDLQVIFARAITPDRVRLGWQNDTTGFSSYMLSGRNPVTDAMRLAWSQRDRVHIVNGLWAVPSFAAALVVLANAGSKFAIYSEAPEPGVSRSKAKKLLRKGFGTLVLKRAAGVLPVSRLAAEFFGGLGVAERRMYPFGYFRSCEQFTESPLRPRKQDAIDVVFVGQIVRRKGIDLLFEAMLPLFEAHPRLTLTLIGTGDMASPLRERVSALGQTDRIIFEGALSASDIPTRLATSDLLVLPSRWDGWGLVVNEAFHAGVPVIVSDQCGASDLICKGANGYVFRNEDVSDLRARLVDFLARRPQWTEFRARSAATGVKISTEEVAPYLVECVRHMTGLTTERPTPPWVD